MQSGCNCCRTVLQTVYAADWTAAYSQGVQVVAAANNLCYFDFPVSPGSVHYVIRRSPAVAVGQTITMSFNLSGDGQIIPGPDSGNPPPRVRLFMQRMGDDLTGAGDFTHYRQWSNNSVELTAMGDFTLSQVVSAEQWIGVWGEAAPADKFAATVANFANIGFTFGADMAGHGDLVQNGNVRFTLIRFDIT